MWNQIRAITWAQLRISRNHLPRTSLGTVLSGLLLCVWYGLYAALAVFLAKQIPGMTVSQLLKWLPVGLLGIFLFWQFVPLFTFSSGWSLQLNKLQVYPIDNRALFTIETLLRITSAPEMVVLLTGVAAGLAGHRAVPAFAPLFVFLLVPLSLFLQLAIRDLLLHSFERNRFRELFAVIVISIGILPQLVLRTGLGTRLKPYGLAVAGSRLTPWHEIAMLGLGRFSFLTFALLAGWLLLAFWFARLMFARNLSADDNFQNTRGIGDSADSRLVHWWLRPARLFKDPLGALLQKELQSLVRMPRFRVIFGMSCLMGVFFFVPNALRNKDSMAHFMQNNLFPLLNVYGLLLLGESLLLNIFGFDRAAVQVYFVTPVSLSSVLKAKNCTALVFILLQSVLVLLIAVLVRASLTWSTLLSGLLSSAVVAIYLLAIGNFLSFASPKPMDPRQTFKKQGGAKMQLWALGASLLLIVLLAFAFLADYAFASQWALLSVLAFEFLVGLLIYRFGFASAVERGMRDRERIVQALSLTGSPVSLG